MLAAHDLAPADVGDQSVKHQSAVALERKRANWNLTTTLERRQERPLGADLQRRFRVVQRQQQLAHPLVILANLHGDRALPGSGQPVRCVEIAGDPL